MESEQCLLSLIQKETDWQTNFFVKMLGTLFCSTIDPLLIHFLCPFLKCKICVVDNFQMRDSCLLTIFQFSKNLQIFKIFRFDPLVLEKVRFVPTLFWKNKICPQNIWAKVRSNQKIFKKAGMFSLLVHIICFHWATVSNESR